MRTLKRNESTLYYCLFKGTEELTDDYGNVTGEYLIRFEEPVKFRANVSPATGQSSTEQFGGLEDYDKVIVTADMTCPIDENAVLFIDKAPDFDLEGNPQYDYIVRRVAKSLNSISIAVSKVDVS